MTVLPVRGRGGIAQPAAFPHALVADFLHSPGPRREFASYADGTGAVADVRGVPGRPREERA